MDLDIYLRKREKKGEIQVNKYKKILVFCLPIIILLLMTVLPLLTHSLGDSIVLKTKPYDPRDLFRGDYVVLEYEIEEVPVNKFEDGIITEDSYGYNGKEDKVYIVLKEIDGIHEVDYISKKRPKSKIYVKANIEYIPYDGEIAMLNCGLDSYFVPENTGRELEDLSRKGNVLAEVKVLNGYALLKSIVEDKR